MNRTSEKELELSIIIAAYNSAKTLRHCLQSVLSSSFSNYEIIVVDDGSSDSTSEIAREFTTSVFRFDENQGRNIARRFGYSKARAPIIVNLDSDIVIAPDTLRKLMHLVETDPDEVKVWAGYLAKPLLKPGIAEFMKELKLHRIHSSCRSNAGFLYGGFFAFDASLVPLLRSDAAYADDTEMGLAFSERGHRIEFREELQVHHLKRYGLIALFMDELRMAFDWPAIFFRRRLWNPSERTAALMRHFLRHLFSLKVCKIFLQEKGLYGLLLCFLLYLITIPAIILGTLGGTLFECTRMIPLLGVRKDSPAV